MGYGDLGAFGHSTIKTPNFDNMAHRDKGGRVHVAAQLPLSRAGY